MKILVAGKMKNKKISLSYRMFILSMIKKIISDFDQSYFEEMFFMRVRKLRKPSHLLLVCFLKTIKLIGIL